MAGRSMAQGITRYLASNEELTILVSSHDEAIRLRSLIEPVLPCGARLRLVTGFHRESFQAVGALHVPDPGLAKWELLRSGQPANAFSITGVIHTLCSESVFNSVAELESAPLQPWDALVCTSQAGRVVVQRLLDHRHQALERRFGTALPRPPGPQLPLIPLAVEDPLASLAAATVDRRQLRHQARIRLEIPPQALVVLFLGRLSFHSKAHPLPLYRAMARLQRRLPDQQLILLECGHLFNSSVADAYDQLQQQFPQLHLRRIGGLKPASDLEKSLALAAADLFVSPADNLQETFGLSVIEAMAASLPTIVSDWDGYKDLVDDGVTGLRIPVHTAFSAPDRLDPLDRSYRLGLIDYDNMIGVLSLAAVVDELALEQALAQLASDPALRQSMGEQARARWQRHFCWEVVQQSYRQLWLELAALRQQAGVLQPEPPAHPPMGALFAGYGTKSFTAKEVIARDGHTPADFLDQPMTQLFSHVICGAAHQSLIKHLTSQRRLSCADLTRMGVPASRHGAILAMLVKLAIAEPLEQRQ
ncbi:glycosyltransferase family 4 protein [Cyanobium sp. HWJ4-Hawea]|uniref:glycosyltransferase family 4 protein n=1 Tax=Cyanobium sp. HWJ4-Hawea TaxID=2823713 RepID=UPI0020CCADB5|nr:glycosyltransferase family 4 protein [Cyanobium sp. HWJ4-Hawea]